VIDGCGWIGERVGGLHDNEGRAGDEALGLQQPINTGFRDEGLLAIGEGDSHFARAQFRLVERVCDDPLADLVGDAVPDPLWLGLAILKCIQAADGIAIEPSVKG
jgi:hypothetical protein